MNTNGAGRTCGNCHYFEPIKGQPRRVGNCLAEPPLAFAAMAPNPASVIAPHMPQAMPVIQSMERPVEPTRRACRHWEIANG
jgi:hypothetical protein